MPFLKFVNCYLTANQGYFLSGFVNWSLQICSETVFGSIDDHTIEDEVRNASKKRKSYAKYTPEDRSKIAKYGS